MISMLFCGGRPAKARNGCNTFLDLMRNGGNILLIKNNTKSLPLYKNEIDIQTSQIQQDNAGLLEGRSRRWLSGHVTTFLGSF